jgi:H+/gluconate symporter-like permease
MLRQVSKLVLAFGLAACIGSTTGFVLGEYGPDLFTNTFEGSGGYAVLFLVVLPALVLGTPLIWFLIRKASIKTDLWIGLFLMILAGYFLVSLWPDLFAVGLMTHAVLSQRRNKTSHDAHAARPKFLAWVAIALALLLMIFGHGYNSLLSLGLRWCAWLLGIGLIICAIVAQRRN